MVDAFSAVFGDGRGSGHREPELADVKPLLEVLPEHLRQLVQELDEEFVAFLTRLPMLTPPEAARIGSTHDAVLQAQPERVEGAWRVARDIAWRVQHVSARWDEGWDASVLATPKQHWDELEDAVRDGVMALAMRSFLSNDDFELFYGAWR